MPTEASGRDRLAPAGYVVRLGRRRIRVLDGGRVLIGGSPTTVLSLGDRAAQEIRGRRLTVTDGPTGALANQLLDLGIAEPVLELLPPGDEVLTVVVPVHGRPDQLRCLLASIDGVQ